MSTYNFELEAKVTGANDVNYALGYAPAVLSRYLKIGMHKERGAFVGTQKKNQLGSFQKPMLRRRLWGGRVSRFSSMWSVNFLRHFRGKVYDAGDPKNPLAGLTLEMGISKSSKMRPIIEMLQSGGTSNANGYMLIPVYHNLDRLGEFPKVGSSANILRRMLADKSVSVVKQPGVILYYDRKRYKTDPHGALLFYGVRKSRIASQFNFEAAFNKRYPKALERLRKSVDRGVEAINRKQFK